MPRMPAKRPFCSRSRCIRFGGTRCLQHDRVGRDSGLMFFVKGSLPQRSFRNGRESASGPQGRAASDAVIGAQVHAVKEMTKSINKSGLKSSATAQRYYDLLHFLKLDPVAELAFPMWITQACFEERASTLDIAAFWPPETCIIKLQLSSCSG